MRVRLEEDFKFSTMLWTYLINVGKTSQTPVEFWPLHYTQINIKDSKTVSILSHSPMDRLSTSPSLQWISIALEHHQTTLRWGMVIRRTLRWWEGSVEMAATSPTPCKPLNATWGSGERWRSRTRIQFHNFLTSSDSFPTILGVDKGSALNTKNYTEPHKRPTELVHVEALSLPQKESSLHHPTHGTTQMMQTVSTLSLSQTEHMSASPSSPWILIVVTHNQYNQYRVGLCMK